jgi:uncharacterized protein (DUF736 family)
MAPAGFFPPPDGFASRSKKAGRRHPPLALRALPAAAPIAFRRTIAIEAAMGAVRAAQARRTIMATIGTFTKFGDGYTGSVKTLTLNVKAKLSPAEKDNEKAPDFRIFAGATEFGAAWKKTSREGRDYLSVKLDDPSFPAPIYASLVEVDGEDGLSLIWSRRNAD